MAEEAFARGARAAERNDLPAAQEHFAQALHQAPDSTSLHARIGLAYMPRIGPDIVFPEPAQAARALPHLRRALELDGDQPFPVHLQAILAAVELDREAEARRLLTQATRIFHDDAVVLNNIGYALVDADKLTADALPVLERAVALEPKSGIIIDSLGWAHYRLGNLRRAAGLLERASDLAPDNAEIEYHLGVVYAHLGRTEEANARFRRALEIDPRFAPARAAVHELRREQ